MKTPEQQEADAQAHAAAQEYAVAEVALIPDRVIEMEKDDYIDCTKESWLAGHAAGKQDAEQRIWEQSKRAHYLDGECESVELDQLKRIIFGAEKVETQMRYEGGVFNPTTGSYDMKPLNVTKDEGGEKI